MSATEPKESWVGLNEANRSRCESGPLLPPEQPNAPPAPAPEGLTPEQVAIARQLSQDEWAARLCDSHEVLREQVASLTRDLATLQHMEQLLEARTQRGITDASTPLHIRVDNIVEQLNKAESTLASLRARLEPIREMEQKATIAPWRALDGYMVIVDEDVDDPNNEETRIIITSHGDDGKENEANVRLTAALRNACPDLIQTLWPVGEK